MMVANMDPAIRFLFLASCLLSVEKSVGSVGPVFVNPSSASVAVPNIQTAKGNYVTQTVYGFLDFTTTIGNTVMVFSPQSAAAATEEKRKSDASNSVIETKPVTDENKNSAIIIKPSRTQFSAENAPSELSSPRKISSIVQVQSNPPVVFSSEIEIKPFPPSSLNVIEGVSSVVNTASSGPIFSSIVEIIPPPQQNAIKKVEPQNNKEKEQQQQQQQPFILSSHVEVYTGPSLSSVPQPPLYQPPILSSIVEVHSDETPAVVVGNNIGEPEYDFLSRQPSEVVEETYKVINLKPSSKFHLKPRASLDAKNNLNLQTKRADSIHPTGLVTKLGGTVVKDGITTVHETSVIGTYISGKYAQVLQSTSHIVNNNHQKGKINPSPSLRILKTAAPSLGKGNKHHRHLDPTPAGSVNEETALPVEAAFNSQNSIKSTRKPTATGGSFKPRFKNRVRDQEVERDEGDHEVHQNKKKTTRLRPSQLARNSKQHTPPHRPPKYGRSSKTTTVSVHSEDTTPPSTFGNGKRYQSRKNKQRDYTAPTENINNNNNSGYSRRGYKPRVQTSTVEQISASTSLYKFKLNRSPGRWQYKTTPKPRVTIRKQQNSGDDDQNAAPGGGGTTPSYPQDAVPSLNDVVTPQARSDDVDSLVGSESIASIIDDESSTENKLDTPLPLETIKVEISTPADFKDVYYEIATIKSPYTFQVGSVKNTRYITVTSTFEKSLATTADGNISPSASEPLTENILATSSNYAKDNNFLDSSIATLPPLYLASDMETPPLETLVETFSTTQTMLKTHILPIVRGGNDTSISTLVQTYLVTRIVTASKTLPPMEAYHFIPSKTLNEFNSHLDEAGSELHLELEFGDENDQDDGARAKKVFPPDLDLAKVGSDFDLSDVDKSKLPEALLKLKKAQTTTTPKPPMEPVPTPALSPEQLQQLALLRLLNPAAAPPTPQQVVTTSKPIVKVETVYESHVIPVFNGASTILSTISKIIGTVTKTDYEFGTSTVPALPLPPVPVNPLFPQPQPQFAVTSSPVVQSTVITQTDSKILKLTFGAKTAYTTIFSTKIVPTVLTTYMTASVPVQPTAAFPGFFPAPYPAFPYVG